MSSNPWLFVGVAVLAGALGGVHLPINGALGARVQSTIVATFAFYGVAFLVISSLALATLDREAFRALARTPVWYWLVPGLISVVVVGANTWVIPRFGAINVFVVALLAQTLVRLAISHFGWFETPLDPVTAPKLVGAAMVASGAWLAVRA